MPPKKKVTGLIKLQIKAGAATPAPPIGPALPLPVTHQESTHAS